MIPIHSGGGRCYWRAGGARVIDLMTRKKNGLFGLTGKAKEHLIQQVLDKRKDMEQSEVPPPKNSRHPNIIGSVVPNKFTRFDKYPAYQEILVQKLAGETLKIANPFFRVHTGVAGSTTVIDGREYINFANYNYLDLCGHPDVSEAAHRAIEQYGTSVSANRLVGGERPIQRELEEQLAKLHDVDDSLVFVSGHATNVTTIGYLFGPKDLILHDALIHNSIIQGAQLSGAHRMLFPHNDWKALDEILTRSRREFERVLIVIEGIYSMDGDFPDLERFIEVKKRHKAFLMIDEAHSYGVLGARGFGIGEHFNVKGKDVDIWMGTYMDGHPEQDPGQLRRLYRRAKRLDRAIAVPCVGFPSQCGYCSTIGGGGTGSVEGYAGGTGSG